VVATGEPYANRYVSVLTLREGEVVSWRDYLDPLAVFDALGWPHR
jgi:ketosteroid isomerase-like protein